MESDGDTMGLFYTEMEVGSPMNRVFTAIKPVVDTGAIYSMLPASLLEQILGLSPFETLTVTLADGRRETYGLGEARFKFEGRERTSPVLFGPDDVYILGAGSLQSFGLIADTTQHKLIPSPMLLVGFQ